MIIGFLRVATVVPQTSRATFGVFEGFQPMRGRWFTLPVDTTVRGPAPAMKKTRAKNP